jgi:hypothetical protein
MEKYNSKHRHEPQDFYRKKEERECSYCRIRGFLLSVVAGGHFRTNGCAIKNGGLSISSISLLVFMVQGLPCF